MTKSVKAKLLETLRSIRGCLELRRKYYQALFDDNVANQRWSQIAGYHGIVTGVMVGIREIDDRIKELERKR